MTSVAVVVPVYNAGADLRPMLERLAEEHARHPFQLVLCDNGSDDGSWELVQEFAATADFVEATRALDAQCPAHARNHGVRRTDADRLLFCDADDIVGENWVAVMEQALDRHEFIAGAKSYEVLNSEVLRAVRRPILSTDPQRLFGYLIASGCNFACRRSLWERLGGQDETLPPGAEDSDFAMRAQRELGVAPVFVPEAVVHYRLRDGVAANYRQARAYGFNEVVLYARHGSYSTMRRVTTLIRRVLELLVVASRAPFSEAGRLKLAWRVGQSVGRVRACIRHRVFYL